MSDVRAELLRVQALHQEIAERLRTSPTWVRHRYENNFMSPEFHARCVADYERWIKERDALEAELKEAREQVGQYREALERAYETTKLTPQTQEMALYRLELEQLLKDALGGGSV